MATTLQLQSFSESNIRERSSLLTDVVPAASQIVVESTAGSHSGDTLHLGELSREGCERVAVDSVLSATSLALVEPVTLPHRASEPVTSVLGNLIHIHRAVNVHGTVPADELFTVLATRSIGADQLSTYYTDSSGSSNYWYRSTYFNATTMEETSLADSVPVRGDDFGHYCSVREVRDEACFANAYNLSDVTVDQQRRAAEAKINSTLRGAYTVPFVKPLPQRIRYLTIQLAAGLLLQNAYGGQSPLGDSKVKDARAHLAALLSGDAVLDDDTTSMYDGSGISYWPNFPVNSAEHIDDRDGRSFHTED